MRCRWDCSESAGGSSSSFDGSLSQSHIWSNNANDIARNLYLPFSLLTVIYSPIRSVWMCEKDVWEGKGEGLIMREPSEYIKEKGWLYWTTHLSVSTSVPLTVNPGSIALRRPTSPLPFFLPGLFPLLLSLPPSPAPSLPVCSDASSWLTAHKMK